jgi:DNA-cytosine methyltransferase
MKPQTVLSAFDGMSCVQIALRQLGIPIKQYLASEIDKYPIQITQKNYPDTIQLGDITKVFAKDLPPIDILVGGSPCQGFSFAGDQLAFDDPRSALFFEFVRLLKECKPKYFLLENVRMKKEFLDVITEQLGVEPILINSALVSAQNRQRYYWTNIEGVEQPEDRGLVLKDILEDSDWVTDRDKSHCLDANYFKGGNLKSYFEKHRRQLVFNKPVQVGTADIKGYDIIKRVYSPKGKSPTLTTMQGGHREPKVLVSKKSVEKYVPDKDAKFCDPYNKKTIKGDKSTTLRTNSSNGNMWVNDPEVSWRKLTPLECERLQTVPDGYTEGVSNTQRYKMLGNGMTVEVIKHIFKNIK